MLGPVFAWLLVLATGELMPIAISSRISRNEPCLLSVMQCNIEAGDGKYVFVDRWKQTHWMKRW